MIMQKKSMLLQVFRVLLLVFLMVGSPHASSYAQMQAPLLQGQMRSFKLLPVPAPLLDVGWSDGAGNGVSLSRFRGKLVLLTLWATWCPFCARELPSLNDLQENIGRDRFVVVAVSVDKEGPDIVKKYLEEKSLNLPAYSDARNRIAKMLGLHGVPFSVLIDQDGREIGRIHGETNWMAPESIQLIRTFLR